MRAAASFALAVVALAALAQPAAASPTDDFRSCFCWDKSADNFCGGEKWYDTDACHRWFWHAWGFAIPAIIGGVILAFFPCIFYISRMWCNCCGGRHRTEGCCCSDVESRHRFPEYPNRSIFLAKLMLNVVFGAYIYYAVGGYVSNAKLHTDLLAVVDDFGNAVDGVGNMMKQSGTVAKSLEAVALNTTTEVYTIVPPAVAEGFAAVSATFAKRVDQIHTQLDNIREAENSQQFGRAESVYRYPSCVLLVLLFAVLFMVCNLRKTMGPIMVLVCWLTVVEGCVFVPHMILAQGIQAVCHSYNQTLVPIAVGAIEQQRGCNDAGFAEGLALAANNVEAQMWFPNSQSSVYPSNLCSAMQTVCTHFNCTYNTCGGGAAVNGERLPFRRSDEPAAPYNIFALQMVIETPFQRLSATAKGTAAPMQSIATCAISSCADAPKAVRDSAKLLADYFGATYPQLAFLFEEALPSSYNCSAVRDYLHGTMHDDLCTGVNRRMTTVALMLGIMYLLGFIALPVLIRGMKRFTPMKRNQSLADVARETVYYADARVNAVPYVGHEVCEASPMDADQSMRGYGAVNGDAAQPQPPHQQHDVHRMADAAMRSRFGYHGAGDEAARPLVGDTGASTDAKPL